MPTKTFTTPDPIKLFVEVQAGDVTVTAADTDTTHVEVRGKQADQTTIEQDGDEISVIGPKARNLFGSLSTNVVVTVPTGSQFRTKTGSGDVTTSGTLLAVWGTTGSGDLVLDTVTGPVELKSGSGDVKVSNAGESVKATTGTGDLRVGTAVGQVSLRTGSGDASIDRISRGEVTCKSGTGDFRIGIPAGTPVWTDINTGSGRIRTEIPSAGQPSDGQDSVKIRARTGTGDVALVPAS